MLSLIHLKVCQSLLLQISIDGLDECIEIDVGMFLFKVESRSHPDCSDTATSLNDTKLFKFGDNAVADLNCLAVKSQIGAFAAHTRHMIRVDFRERFQLFSQVGARIGCQLRKFVFLNDRVLLGSQDLADRVAHVRVAMAVRSDHPRVLVVVHPTRQHLLSKGHEVGWRPQVPLFVRPERACHAYTGLYFIDDKVDVELLGYVLESLCKFVGEPVVSAFAHDRFDYDCGDFNALLVLPLNDLASHVCKRGGILSIVILLVFC